MKNTTGSTLKYDARSEQYNLAEGEVIQVVGGSVRHEAGTLTFWCVAHDQKLEHVEEGDHTLGCPLCTTVVVVKYLGLS